MNEEQLEITFGKGKVLIDPKTAERLRGKSLSLGLESEKGPCDGVSCQIIQRLDVQTAGHTEGDWTVIEGGGVSISVHPDVYRSIDRGRETVTLKMNRKGKFTVRGFSYVS